MSHSKKFQLKAGHAPEPANSNDKGKALSDFPCLVRLHSSAVLVLLCSRFGMTTPLTQTVDAWTINSRGTWILRFDLTVHCQFSWPIELANPAGEMTDSHTTKSGFSRFIFCYYAGMVYDVVVVIQSVRQQTLCH